MKTGENEYKVAVGLEYDEVKTLTPLVSLKGEKYLAQEIVKIARRFGVPVIEEGTLAETLCKLDLDQEIPEELFEAVAVIISVLEGRGKSQSANNE